jgi:Mg-chelatase subunit ChlD
MTSAKESVHLILALDCSGSMKRIRDQLLEGYQTFLRQQREQSGECSVTVVTFSSEPQLVFERKPLQEVSAELDLVCAGMTALYDTVGWICRQYAGPQPTILVVISDDRDTVSKMSKEQMLEELEQRKKNGWTVVTLCKSARDVPPELNPLPSVHSEFGSVLSGQLSRVVSTARALSTARDDSVFSLREALRCSSV